MEDPIVIDLRKNSQLNESWLRMFGSAVESILKAMFGGYTVPVSIRGSRSNIKSFANVLGREKEFLKASRDHGLDNPLTYKNKSLLNQAVKGFERDTGVSWPFK